MNAIVKVPLLAISTEQHRQISQDLAGEIGIGLLAVGLLLGAVYVVRRLPIWWDRWSKHRLLQERRKQLMGSRETELHRKVQDLLGDGLLTWSVNGDINHQEERKLCEWLAEQLDMPELVPPESRSDKVKKQIMANRDRMRKVKPKLPDSNVKEVEVVQKPRFKKG